MLLLRKNQFYWRFVGGSLIWFFKIKLIFNLEKPLFFWKSPTLSWNSYFLKTDTEGFYLRRKRNSANLKNLDKFKEIFESWRAKNFRTSIWKITKRNFWRRQMATTFPLPNSRSTKVQAPHYHFGPKETGQHNLPTSPKLFKSNGNEHSKGDSSHPLPPTSMPKSSFPSAVLPRLFYLSGSQESTAKSVQSLIMWAST